ncbi:Matrix metalloproteinase-17 [Myotis davidii]|uniref:Matrix metalloproteinase-17 n=1 Tax=Myotis davidii TaxID=225400 RepID=L5LKJ3_MYODS|nr:Matrix metalloproteinase-17 [Myotis davidii]
MGEGGRERERERERERNIHGERESWIGCLLHAPHWGSSPQPGPVPHCTSWFVGPRSTTEPLPTIKPHFQIASHTHPRDRASLGAHCSLLGARPVPLTRPLALTPGSDPARPRVRTFPRDSPLGRDMVRALMHYALKVWGDITPLNFHEVAGSAADIQIDFSTADHNDRYPFDGPGGTVAHAFLPGDHHTAGDAHFDDDEAWTFRSSDAHGMDLFAVAVHEFGHAIGLSHVAATQSIMQPYYQGPVGDPLHYGLPYADRVRAWQLYGVRESVSPTAQPDTAESEEPPLLPEPPGNRPSTPPGKDVPHRCSAHFDAVAQIRGEAFFFKADFGFARYLQSNMMAATLCGSPMYMAPEVIMSQHYDGKADLWSIGTIVYQCLTGKAPFQASSPQDLRLFYEKNKTLVPIIPRETSAPLRQLLLALLQRNHKDRMDFGDLVAEAAGGKPPPDSLMCSGSSLVASAGLESHGRTPSPSPPCSGSPKKKRVLGMGRKFGPGVSLVAVPSDPASSLSVTRSRPGPFSGSRCGASVPIPVPTQVQNYQRIEQNLQSPTQFQTPRSSAVRRSGSTSPLGFARASPSPPSHAEHGAALARKLSLGLWPHGNQAVPLSNEWQALHLLQLRKLKIAPVTKKAESSRRGSAGGSEGGAPLGGFLKCEAPLRTGSPSPEPACLLCGLLV